VIGPGDSIADIGRRLRARTLTSEALTDECLQRIEADNHRLNAFILVLADQARRQAHDADRELAAGHDRGPLHGVPISIKDLIDVAGTPTTAASRVRAGHVADRDAPVIASLRQAGAVFVGKTNLHEFALGTTSEDSAFGPARNPYDVTRSPGGSSGGAGISVAAGMAVAAIGTDTGGSIRIPSAACGVVGLKPDHGELSTAGVIPLSDKLDHVGPLTRNAADARVIYRLLTGRRPASTEPPVPIVSLRLAVPRPYFLDLLDDEVRRRFDEALERLRAAGAHVTDVAIPHTAAIAATYLNIVLTDAFAYHRPTLERAPEQYTAPVRQRLEMGRLVSASDYHQALNMRDVLRRDVSAALAGHDALMLPTLPIPAPLIGAETVQIGERNEPVRPIMLRLTQLFNLTGHPAIALPAGTTSAGLPCSLQLVGADTESLLRVALACEPQISV
jgi:aspartyl-tRNA(Asn)/glutamyl-tRNA(Gln) amidotransferase subunit A